MKFKVNIIIFFLVVFLGITQGKPLNEWTWIEDATPWLQENQNNMKSAALRDLAQGNKTKKYWTSSVW